jgi:hypothetical protein
MKKLALLLTLSILPSCVSYYKPPTVKTTTVIPTGRYGVFGTTTTETPYESPAYREAGTALFSRP